jgi:hypothetical protein
LFQEKKVNKTGNDNVQDTNASSTTIEEKKIVNGLEINDIRKGNGPEAKLGKTVDSSLMLCIHNLLMTSIERFRLLSTILAD